MRSEDGQGLRDGKARVTLRVRLFLLVCLATLLPAVPVSFLLLGGLRGTMIDNMRKLAVRETAEFSSRVVAAALGEDHFGINRQLGLLFEGDKALVFAAVYDRAGAKLESRARDGFNADDLPPASSVGAGLISRQVKLRSGGPALDISAPIIHDGSPAGSVRLCLSMEEIDAELRGRILPLASLIGIFLFLAVLVSFRFSLGITRSVNRLLAGIRKIRTEGDFSFRVETSSNDEVGDLGEEFNRMAADLNKTTVSRDALAAEVEERRKAEAALLASRQYLADIINFLPDATFVVDKQGQVVSWNRAMEEVTGMPAGAMLGKGNAEYSYCLYGKQRSVLLDLVLKQDLSSEEDYLSIIRRGRTLIAEAFVPTIVGRGFFATAKAAPLYDHAGNFMGAIEIMRDMTERKLQDDRIRDFTNGLIKLHMGTEALVNAIGTDGLYKAVCARALDIAGLSVCGLVGVKDGERVLLACSEGEEVFAGDLKALCAEWKGREHDFISKAGETREAVFFQNLVEAPAPDSLMRHAIKCGFKSCLACPLTTRDSGVHVLVLYSRAAGHFTPDNLNLYSILANQVSLALEIVWLVDSLEQKVQERTSELSVQKQNAEQAMLQAESANKAKSAFLTNMSHELRTPLNIILVSSEVLETRMFGTLNEKQDEYVRNVRNSGRHLLNIINDILDLAKVEAGAMELKTSKVDVADLLAGVLSLFTEQAARKGIRLVCNASFGGKRISIAADELKLKQVLINLLTNAIKFTGKGGAVTLEAREVFPCDDRLRRADPASFSPGVKRYLLVSVRDTGIGIKPEDMGKLFKHFSQVDSSNTRSYEGTGLGLVLVKKLVELHGGRIWAESCFGEGSVFNFALPFVE